MAKKKEDERFRRMSGTDIAAVIADLAKWSRGELGSKLTWAILEQRFGFSRQSLQAKTEIKSAYLSAKKALGGELIGSKNKALQENAKLLFELDRLKVELDELKRKEVLWLQRWQRIAYHLRQKGLSISNIDKPTPLDASLPSERMVASILRPFDKEIPPSGRI